MSLNINSSINTNTTITNNIHSSSNNSNTISIMPLLAETVRNFFASSYSGIDPNLMSEGGVECYNFLTIKERMVDTFAYFIFALVVALPIVVRTLSVPQQQLTMTNPLTDPSKSIVGFRKFLLITTCFVFGFEMGFKVMRETWIYALNVCHALTMVQIYLLSAQASTICAAVFRTHVHLLFAPLLAIVFPSTGQRSFTGEVFVFWVQHILIFFIVPSYLISIGGPYTCEPIRDISWAMFSILVIGFYMYVVTQGIGMMTYVNLTTVLCPAPSDPFYGPYYRLFALVGTVSLTLVSGKIYYAVVSKVLKLVRFLKDSTLAPLEESPTKDKAK